MTRCWTMIGPMQWLTIYYYPVQLYLLVYNFLSFTHKYITDKTIIRKLKVAKLSTFTSSKKGLHLQIFGLIFQGFSFFCCPIFMSIKHENYWTGLTQFMVICSILYYRASLSFYTHIFVKHFPAHYL